VKLALFCNNYGKRNNKLFTNSFKVLFYSYRKGEIRNNPTIRGESLSVFMFILFPMKPQLQARNAYNNVYDGEL